MTRSSAFGAQGRTRVLLALRLLSESYPRQLAGVLAMPVSSVQKALQGLERDALVAGRSMNRLSLRLDRVQFIKWLEQVRDVRNDVMHFDPDPVSAEDLQLLREVARMMQTLLRVGAV